MAEVQSLSHSGICVHDLKEAEDFYCGVLGAKPHAGEVTQRPGNGTKRRCEPKALLEERQGVEQGARKHHPQDRKSTRLNSSH